MPAGTGCARFPGVKDLTQGSVTRHLLSLSAFTAVSMLFQTLYYLADLYFVGRLGKEAIVAVGLAGNLTFVVLAITQTLGVGTTTLVSHAVGRKDPERANLAFNHAFALSLAVGLVVAGLGFALRGPYCRWLGADEVTARLGVQYLNWFIPAMLLQFVIVAMASALRGSGVIGPTVAIQILSVVLNIMLAPVLILGWGRDGRWGWRGRLWRPSWPSSWASSSSGCIFCARRTTSGSRPRSGGPGARSGRAWPGSASRRGGSSR